LHGLEAIAQNGAEGTEYGNVIDVAVLLCKSLRVSLRYADWLDAHQSRTEIPGKNSTPVVRATFIWWG